MTIEQPKNKFLQPGRVKVINGSILTPHDAGLRIILNVANMAGKMESPLYSVFEKKWPKVKQEVRGSFVTKTGTYKLGTIAANTAVQSDVWCVSLLCQDSVLQTDVVALDKCLKEVCKLAKTERASVHISSLLVNAIPDLQDLVTKQLVDQGVAVLYYEEPAQA